MKAITAANYIDGLIALGRFGGENQDSLGAMRLVSKDLRDRADLDAKNKEERIAALMERGGYGYIADQIASMVEKSRLQPAHSAAGRRMLQSAVLCAALMNKPPRKGDIVTWRFGHELIRDPDGSWRATWEQEKTGHETESGVLWPEVCELLDLWILGDRPDRLVVHCYREMVGRNWLSLTLETPYRNLPSKLTHSTIGVPSHDLRTLAADYLRRHDPARAAQIIATHLGHVTQEAGRAYASECSGISGQRLWQNTREMIAAADGNTRIALKANNQEKRSPKKGAAKARFGAGRVYKGSRKRH